jgi:hypothetical protein
MIAEGAWAAENKEEAKSRFITGQSHYNLNEFAQALQEFKEAYRLFPDPVFLYNAGQCERQLNHYEEAIAFYRSFLRNQPKAPNRNEVKRKIEEMENALKNKINAPLEPAHSDDPPSTPLTPPQTAPPLTTPAEEKTAVPATDSQQPIAEPTSAMPVPEENKPTAIQGPLGKLPVPLQSNPVTHVDLSKTSPAPAAPPTLYRRWWFWTATGIVVTAATTAVVLSVSGNASGPPSSVLGGKKVF